MLKAIGYRPRWGVSAGLLVALLFALSLPAPASAGTISVTTTFDELDGSAPCSLREAVNTANADANSGGCTDANPASADTIKLAGGDYNLRLAGAEDANASGDLDVTESLTIIGAGADATYMPMTGPIANNEANPAASWSFDNKQIVRADKAMTKTIARMNPGHTLRFHSAVGSFTRPA